MTTILHPHKEQNVNEQASHHIRNTKTGDIVKGEVINEELMSKFPEANQLPIIRGVKGWEPMFPYETNAMGDWIRLEGPEIAPSMKSP